MNWPGAPQGEWEKALGSSGSCRFSRSHGFIESEPRRIGKGVLGKAESEKAERGKLTEVTKG
jgi:hypothetical protein